MFGSGFTESAEKVFSASLLLLDVSPPAEWQFLFSLTVRHGDRTTVKELGKKKKRAEMLSF